MSAVTAKVTGVTLNQKGNIATVGFDINGKVCTAKAFPKDYGTDNDAWTVGESYQVEFEKKTNEWGGKTTEETWAKKVKAKAGGGGRGAPKADPERTQIERERLNTYQLNSELNRQRDDYKQCLIIAQVCAKGAIDLYAQELNAHGGEFDSIRLSQLASEIGAVITKTADEIQRTLTPPSTSGGTR